MSIAEIPMNLTKLSNITSPDLNISSDPTIIFQQIVDNANAYTSHWLGFFIMSVISIIIYLSLSDKTPFGDFKYDDARALSIAFGISSIIGIKMIELGFINNYLSVAQFIYLFLLSIIFVWFYENRE